MAPHDEILRFWFGDGRTDAEVARERTPVWFGRNADFDAEIARRFAGLRDSAVRGDLRDWQADPRGTLALILLVDQFSRNLFRNDARAYARDALAQQWSRAMRRSGTDRQLRAIERLFVALPLEHSESLDDQDAAVALCEELLAAVAPEARPAFAGFLDYAHRHREIIRRFGRFPHRNAVLGRASTAEELEFLRTPGSSF